MRVAAFALFLFPCFAQQDPTPGSGEYFEKYVRPVLAERCQNCHNPKAKTAGLDLTTGEGFLHGADSGVLVNKENPADSRIVKAVSYLERIKMPPTGKLKDTEIAAISEWVKAGAVWPGVSGTVAEAKPAPGKKFTDRQKNFWSFQPRRAVTPPAVRDSSWVKTPIDQFILAKLEEKGLSPAPAADKLTLLRRATYDLTGLPPSEKEIADFLADSSPNAFEKVIDRLLASPRYGERWGRHWMDVARYADSTGADEDHRYPDAWRYRDYVIDSFNRDVPYNRFVIEQLAGDMLPPEGADVAVGVNRRGVVATGFLAIGPRLIAEQDKKKMFYDFVDEQIGTTTRAFLGLTVDCARCHDHKFDPILQKDYYSLASIFASTKSFADVKAHVSVMYRPPLVSKDQYKVWTDHQERVAAKQREIEMIDREQAQIRLQKFGGEVAQYLLAASGKPATSLDPAIVNRWTEYLAPKTDVRPYLSRWEKAGPAQLAEVAQSYQTEFQASAAEYNKAVEKWLQAIETAKKSMMPGPARPDFDNSKHRFFEDVFLTDSGPFGMKKQEMIAAYPKDVQAQRAALDAQLAEIKKGAPEEPDLAIGVSEGDAVTQHLFVRGDAHNEGEVVGKQFPVILAGFEQTPVAKGSGRMELAKWITDPANPLPTRVIVNRIWQWQFGEGIARTPSNFGLLGERPTHPELLDWMAQRFIDGGWSIKKMNKLIMLSSAYQMSSKISKEAAEKDASNKLWSHFMRRRLDVEEIRDSMLAMDGSIDLTMGGSLQEGTGTDGENSSKRLSVDPATVKRRTVYIPLRRSNLPSLLNLFDFGDATTTSEGRARTNVAPQALFAMNSPFVNARAGVLAEQTRQQDLDSAVRVGFVKVLNRQAKDAEVQELVAYMKKFPGDSEFAARRSMFRILLGSNEFIYVD